MKCNHECTKSIKSDVDISSSTSILEIIRKLSHKGVYISIYFENDYVYVQSVKGESTLRVPLMSQETCDKVIKDTIMFCYNNQLVDDAMNNCKRGCD